MIARREANRCRFEAGTQAGHYESYFLRANHPQRALAFWIRYTFFSPKGRPGEAEGELWAVFFNGERGRVTAVKECFPLADCEIGTEGLDLRIGDAHLGDACLLGSVTSGRHAIDWTLGYASCQPPLLLMPEPMYGRAFPKAKVLVPAPCAYFSGEMLVDGERIGVDDWCGSQNHNWGSRHTDTYAWGQVAGFDGAPDVFLECSTARVKVGPFWTPAMTLFVLRIGDTEFALNSVTQALRTQGEFDFFSWEVRARAAGIAVVMRISAPRSRFVGLRYPNPPGGVKTCLNSKLASCELTVEQTGQPTRRYATRHRAAFEILTDRRDHGVAMLA